MNYTVVIAGGGVAALEAALALRALAEERVRVELVAPEPHFWYRPLAVAEPFGAGKVRRFELTDLAAAAGATFSLDRIVAVDAHKRTVHGASGVTLPYDALLIACGASPEAAVPGALTFRGPPDIESVGRVLADLSAGSVRRIAFAVPLGASWTLPAYELALLTAARVDAEDIRGVELSLVTPEPAPVALFGSAASEAVRALLDERGVRLYTEVHSLEARDGELQLVQSGPIAADVTIALPRLVGQTIDGVPQTLAGFVPVDPHGGVPGLPDVFAAGDITTFPVKQGGIATQQADAAAEAIAARAGAGVTPGPFRPVLRGLLLTGGAPRYLRSDLAGGSGDSSQVELEPLWWPPAKIVGRHLAPFLAQLAGVELQLEAPWHREALRVDVELTTEYLEDHAARRIDALRGSVMPGERTVDDVMSTRPLCVAPEDTLGEVAEKMRERDYASALVCGYGRLIGIITSRDLLRALAGRAHPSEARVREWMTADPIAVQTGTSVSAAATLMVEWGIHHLPVVEGKLPIGLVGLRDVARAQPVGEKMGLGF
jgi:sulfide:quinone oxidoreductase